MLLACLMGHPRPCAHSSERAIRIVRSSHPGCTLRRGEPAATHVNAMVAVGRGAALNDRKASLSRRSVTTITIPNIPKRRSIALVLSPIGLLLISAARLIIVSNYNTTTAVTIASSGGYINTLLGSVIPLVPIFAPYLALLLLLFKRFLLSIMVFIFAAFITPSPITLPQVVSLAVEDWHHLLQLTLFFPWHSQTLVVISIVFLSVAIIFPLWVHHRELAEVAGVLIMIIVATALVLAAPKSSSLPVTLRLASASESQNTHQLLNLTTAYWPVAIAIALSIVFITYAYLAPPRLPRLLSATVAIVATFVLFPYVSNIYPIPHHSSYVSEVLHELWLPAERIVMHSGHVYYGYILSSDPEWDTVLLTGRTIVYLHADDVVHRSVCKPGSTPQPASYPPLIPLLYTPPSPTPLCVSSSPITAIPSISILSHGQSLKAVSLAVHVWPYRIISLTNALLGYHLSDAMRAYENSHNWYAPTPIGQRFWYATNWPKVRPRPVSRQHLACAFGTSVEMSGITVCRGRL